MKRPDTFTFLLALLALQAFVAGYQLTQARPSRFGWQMYSGISHPTGLSVVYTNRVAPLDLSHYLALVRGDVDVAAVFPTVCEREPEAIAVRYRVIPERAVREFPCPR